MKTENKKVPKNGEEAYIVTSDAEAILYGLLLVLIGLIGLLNRGPVGQFFTYCVVFLFGAFHIFFFVGLIFLGLYLMIKKRFYRIRIDLKLLGFFLMLLGLTIGASLESGLTLQNSYMVFSQHMENVQDSLFHISSFAQIPLAGGGIIGYFIAGALNSSITEFGTKIVIVFFLITGFLLIFKNWLLKTIAFLNGYRKNRARIRKEERLRKEKEEIENRALQEQSENSAFLRENREEVPEERFDISREPMQNPTKLFEEVDFSSDKKESEDSFSSSSSVNSSFFDDDIEKEKKEEEKKIPVVSFFQDDDFSSFQEEKEESTNSFDREDSAYSIMPDKKSLDTEEIKPSSDVNEISSSSYEKKLIIEEKKTSEPPKKGPYLYPPIDLLSNLYDANRSTQNIEIADEYVQKINEMFQDFHIGAQVISYTIGPSVTRFDVRTNPGVKLSSIAGIQNELAVKLGGNKTVRVELIVEGKDTSGIEVGNKYPTMVPFREVFQDMTSNTKDKLLIPLGKDISGKVVKTSIDELPHLLVAGTTGSGKSVFIHSIIMTLIMRNTPDELRLLLIDPKKVEFSKYHELPHLLCPIISDASEATIALKRMVDEMERRYEIFATKGKGASKYSEYMEIAEEYNLEKMPNIVMIVDEFADFISQNPKEVESSIQRIAQKARAAGIYMILATQRPSVGFVSGDIKANIPSRIALSVATAMDSRVIIDENGAETLLGKGDLLARVPLSKTLIRVQSAFVPSKDILAVCDYIRAHSEVHYYEPFLDLKEQFQPVSFEGSALGTSGRRTEKDPLHEEVKQFVLETKVASTTKIQNRFAVGFSRADYILDCLEEEGIVKRTPNGRRIVIGEKEEGENNEEPR